MRSFPLRGGWLLLGFLAWTLSTVLAGEGRLPDGVAATVNGRPVPRRIVDGFVRNGLDVLGTADAAADRERLQAGVLDELIDRALIVQGAEERGVAPDAAELAEAQGRTEDGFGGPALYDQFLAQNHFTRDEHRDVVLRHTLCAERLTAALTKDVTVSDADVKAYYDGHQETEPGWQLPERVAAAHILIDTRHDVLANRLSAARPGLAGEELETAIAAEVERRHALAEDLRRRALAGEEFAALAREFSDDPGTRAQGGELTPFPRNAHAPEFSAAAFALGRPGAVSEVVRDRFGFHLIRLREKLPARTATLAEATPEIRSRLLRERRAACLRDWLREARAGAVVVRAETPVPGKAGS